GHGVRDPHRGGGRRRKPVRARPVPGRGRRREGGGRLLEQQGWRGRAVRAAPASVNSRAGGGGLAGRKVVVDFYDSKLNGNESRNATIQGCQSDYALVGTSALFLTQVEDIVHCRDKGGAAPGTPDLSAISAGVPESCSPMAFPAFGTQIDCAT